VTGAAPSRARIWLSFCVITLIWGSTWIVIKDQISDVPAQWSVTWRFIVAALGMSALAVLRRESLRLPREALALAAMVGVAQFSANFQFVYHSEHHLTSGLVAVIYALLLVPNALMSRLFLGTRISERFIAGSFVAIGGIGLLLLNEVRIAPPGGSVPLGLALALGGLMCASTANVIQASERVRPLPIVPFMFWAMFAASLANLAVSFATAGPPVIDPRPEYLAGVVYLGLIGSVVTFPLYSALIRDMGAGPAAYNGVAVPVVAMGLSTLFEGYRWSVIAVIGSMLALAGLVVALSGRK
jgi:drug/metabolite transporter (DMT)-like permease